jgi:membrane protease YdiL (CAAX protease family)
MGLRSGGATFLRQLLAGVGVGVAILAVHVLLLVFSDIRIAHPIHLTEWSSYPRWIGKSLLIGLSVGINEEILFRGFLLAYLVQRMGKTGAIVTSALYFAALHFVNPTIRPTADDVDWFTGPLLVWDALVSIGSRLQPDSFLALATAGAFLATVRIYLPHGLAFCMGLHAGWVFVIKMTRHVTVSAPTADGAFLVSRFDGVIGYLSSGWILLLTLLLIAFWRRSGMNSHQSA